MSKLDWASLGFNPQQLPSKVAVCGFAPSRVEITNPPFNDGTWDLWGVNDLYAYMSGSITRTFEIHHTDQLVEAGRRNPQYMLWLSKGKQPVYMLRHHPEWPSSIRFPYDELMEIYPRKYFTNSIASMTALAIYLLTQDVTLPDGNTLRIARPGAKLALLGIDMSDESEFATQRPCCEYYLGIAEGAGIMVYLPDTSDLCKSAAVYGIDTTAPLRQKLELKNVALTQASQQLDQQLLALQNQKEGLLYKKGLLDGERTGYKYVRRVFTHGTDQAKTPEEGKDRHGEPMPTSPLSPIPEIAPSDNQPVQTEAQVG